MALRKKTKKQLEAHRQEANAKARAKAHELLDTFEGSFVLVGNHYKDSKGKLSKDGKPLGNAVCISLVGDIDEASQLVKGMSHAVDEVATTLIKKVLED